MFKRKFIVTTKVGNKKFQRTFKTVKFVDKYLKGAMRISKNKFPDADEPVFFVNGTKVTKKY